MKNFIISLYLCIEICSMIKVKQYYKGIEVVFMSSMFQIISDGSCDLTPKWTKENNVEVVPFYVSFDHEHYYKEVEEVNIRDFYSKMVENPNVFPKTSLPAIDDYIKIFTHYAEKGIPVLCICITSKFSGSFNAANNARMILMDDYPEAKITVLDSTVITGLQGLFVKEAVRMRDNGITYEETIDKLEKIKDTGRIFFTTADISYLKSGGRLGKLMSIANNTLKVKPMIVFCEGEIFPSGIVRARKKSYEKIIDQVRKHFKDSNENPDEYNFWVGYGYDKEEGQAFCDMILSDLKSYSNLESLDTFQIGATIGVHTGPHPLGIVLLKKYEAV